MALPLFSRRTSAQNEEPKQHNAFDLDQTTPYQIAWLVSFSILRQKKSKVRRRERVCLRRWRCDSGVKRHEGID